MVVEVEVEKELDRVEAQESTENEIPVVVCEVVNDVNKHSYENGNLDMRSSNLTVEDRNLEAHHQEVEGNGDETDRDDDDHSQHYDEEITEGSKVKDEMSHDHDDTSMSSKLDHGTADTDEEIPRAESQNSCDPEILRQQELIERSSRVTELEHALYDSLLRKDAQIERLSNEVIKLKAFISKRKQTYKRKRKDEGAPTRALSAYNIFVQDRFSKLAKENEQALNSADLDAQMRRVPPASLVASTGNQWKELTPEEKNEYEERARRDRQRYEEEMAKYQPPDKQANRKRNKTGYNMFFSAHVLRLKQTDAGVPSERGSVARLVGNAWKQLSSEDKQYYEREADKMNGMNPIDKDDDDDDNDDKRPLMSDYPGAYPPHHPEMHMHPGMPPPMHPHHQHHTQHDPRHAYHYPPNYAYPQPPPYHHYHDQGAVPSQHRHYQGRPHYPYPPPHAAYDQRAMGM